jgi:hypothetical protein
MTPATIETVEQLDEMRARALCVFHDGEPDYPVDGKPMWQGWFLDAARAIRQADERAGLLTINRQLTRKQQRAMDAAPDHIPGNPDTMSWQPTFDAALAASPFASAAQGEGGE